MKSFLLLVCVGSAWASPCPFGDLAERGLLPAEEAESFFAARSGGQAGVEAHLQAKREAEHAQQLEFYKRQVERAELPLGGGLLNGVLQAFTGPTDVRGPCPGLNTMANHGYVSRTGITTFAEAATACQQMLGVAYDNCVSVSALGLLTGGDLLSGKFSIGGADSRVPNTLGPSLGLSRHGFFECDNSVSRQDTYFGNQADFQLDRWNGLVNITKGYDDKFSVAAFGEERVMRYNEAKANNPEFLADDIWLAVTLIERLFVTRVMANGTDPNNPNYDNIAPFFLNETLPENWYRLAVPYNLVTLVADIVSLLAASPELTIPGQNQGLNNFVPLGLDITKLTPTSAACFVVSILFDNAPGFVTPAGVEGYQVVQAFLNGALKPFFAPFNCSLDSFASPSKSAGDDQPGVSTTNNILVNGVYQQSPPS